VCGGGLITAANVTGFRAPFLAYSDWTFDALEDLGVQYDSSVSDTIGSTIWTTALGRQLWPYTMDNGLAGACYSGKCSYSGKWPGLWQIPMNTINEYDPTSLNFGRPLNDTVMDYPLNTMEDLERYYMANFLASYNGNRAPFGIWMHPSWLLANPNRTIWLNNFLAEILAMPGVWAVSGQDVINYIRNPVAVGNTSTVPFACPAPGSNWTRPSPSTITPSPTKASSTTVSSTVAKATSASASSQASTKAAAPPTSASPSPAPKSSVASSAPSVAPNGPSSASPSLVGGQTQPSAASKLCFSELLAALVVMLFGLGQWLFL